MLLKGGCLASCRIFSMLSSNLSKGNCHKWIVKGQSIRTITLTAVVNLESVMNVFDRKAKRKQRNKTAFLENYAVYDYIKDEVGWRLADRMCDVKRKFDVALDLGCGRGHIARNVLQDHVRVLYQSDMAEHVLAQSEAAAHVATYKVHADEEYLPFEKNSFNLVISNLSLHWVNDLPGTFRQVHSVLKDDGCFMGALFGGDTLHELRVSLHLAEIERDGGFAAHVSPFTSAQDLGGLLNRAGFVMLTIDVDEIIVNYPSMMELMYDLKGMGEGNCAWSRQPMLHRDTISAACTIYQEKYGNKDGIPAMFQILYFIGWKPDKTQLPAAERGSGQLSMKDIGQLNKLTKEINELKKSQSTDVKRSKAIDELSKATEKMTAKTEDGNEEIY